jgi:penicillin-binding protein 1C
MDQGRLTPETVLADIPRTFRDFVPSNFDGQFNGLVTARAALGRSLNIPALTLVEEIGEEEFLLLLRRLGLSSLDKPVSRYGLGLALGNGSVRLLDLANAYACLARGGEWRPYSVLEDRQAGDGIRLFSPQACWLMADMLSGDERVAMVAGHRAEVRLPRLAWKTGTSSGFRDAWVVGYNPETVVAVWVGNPDGRPVPAGDVGFGACDIPGQWRALVYATRRGGDTEGLCRHRQAHGAELFRRGGGLGHSRGVGCPALCRASGETIRGCGHRS